MDMYMTVEEKHIIGNFSTTSLAWEQRWFTGGQPLQGHYFTAVNRAAAQ